MSCDVALAPQPSRTLPYLPVFHAVFGWAVLLLVPLLALAVNPNWIYTPKGTIDPWLYHGLFRYNTYLNTYFAGTYYASRLPWVLPGMLAYSALPPLQANYVLHLCFFYITLLALYYTIRAIADSRTGLLTCVLLGIDVHFLYVTGWDYVSCPILAYVTLGLALMTKALNSRRQGAWLCGAGASFVSALYCHFYAAVLAPAVVLYYVCANRRLNGTSLTESTGRLFRYFAAGAALLTAALGTLNVVFLHGEFMFFRPALQAALAIAPALHEWKGANYTWVYTAEWLVLPAAVLIGSCVLLLRGMITPNKQAGGIRLLLPALIVILGAVTVLAELRGQLFLQYHFYSCCLLPFVYLTLAVHFTRVPAEMSNSSFYCLVGAVLAAFGCLGTHNELAPLFPTRTALTAALLIAVAVALTSRALMRPQTLTVASVAIALTVLTSACLPIYLPARADPYVFSRVSMSADIIHDFSKQQHRRVRVWYDSKESNGWEYMGVASVYFYGYALVNDQFPSLKSAYPISLVAGEPLVIVSARDTAGADANQALAEMKLGFRTLDVREIALDSVRYFLTLGVVDAR